MYIVEVSFPQSIYEISEDIISLIPVIKLSQASLVGLEVPINLISITTTGTYVHYELFVFSCHSYTYY